MSCSANEEEEEEENELNRDLTVDCESPNLWYYNPLGQGLLTDYWSHVLLFAGKGERSFRKKNIGEFCQQVEYF